jgi:voltage-gated sodium channel
VGKPAFEWGMVGAISANAVVLGAQTYVDGREQLFGWINGLFLVLYVIELVLRAHAVRWDMREFVRDRWNVFDLVVVVVSLLPAVRGVTMLLRMARIARVAKLMRYLPELRVAFTAVGKSALGVASMGAATALLIFIYGMAGTMLFGEVDAEHYGNIGNAMLTMFTMLTLENLPENIAMGQAVGGWTAVYFISYALIASFLIFNLFIGIVLNAMEEARDEAKAKKVEKHVSALSDEDAQALMYYLASSHQALEEVNFQLNRRNEMIIRNN